MNPKNSDLSSIRESAQPKSSTLSHFAVSERDSNTTVMTAEFTHKGEKKRSIGGFIDYVIDNNFFISQPLTLSYYWTTRGSDNFHIYLWIAKDLAWSQSWYWPAMIFGSGALAWCSVLLYHAIAARHYEEMYMWISLFLWLSGNFVWMAGEVFNGDDDFVVPRTAAIMGKFVSRLLLLHLRLLTFHIDDIH
jgi:hypothetical protein